MNESKKKDIYVDGTRFPASGQSLIFQNISPENFRAHLHGL